MKKVWIVAMLFIFSSFVPVSTGKNSGICVIIEYPEDGKIFHERHVQVSGIIFACCRDRIEKWGWRQFWEKGNKSVEYEVDTGQINFTINVSLYSGKNIIEVWAKAFSGVEGSANITLFYDGPVAYANGPYQGKPGDKIQFDGSVEGGVGPYTWYWDFGDGSHSNVEDPVHEYGESGLYEVSLTVIDRLGRKDTNYTYAIILENIPPHVKITKPTNGVYVKDREIMPFFMPVIVGKITIEASAHDNETGVDKVRFYANDIVIGEDDSPPYQCEWNGIGIKEIKAEAIDYCLNTASDTIKVISI